MMESMEGNDTSTKQKTVQFTYCSVPNCNNCVEIQPENFYRCFHNLPYKDPERMQMWFEKMGIPPVLHWNSKRSIKVCDDHFKPSAYVSPGDKGSYKIRKLLLPDAVPTLLSGVKPKAKSQNEEQQLQHSGQSGSSCEQPSTSSSNGSLKCRSESPIDKEPSESDRTTSIIDLSKLEDSEMTFGDLTDQDFEMFCLPSHTAEESNSHEEERKEDDSIENVTGNEDEEDEEGTDPYACESMVIVSDLFSKNDGNLSPNCNFRNNEDESVDRVHGNNEDESPDRCHSDNESYNPYNDLIIEQSAVSSISVSENSPNASSSIRDATEAHVDSAVPGTSKSTCETGKGSKVVQDSDEESDIADADPYSSNNFIEQRLLGCPQQGEAPVVTAKDARRSYKTERIEVIDVGRSGRVFKTHLLPKHAVSRMIHAQEAGQRQNTSEKTEMEEMEECNDDDVEIVEDIDNHDKGNNSGDLLQAALDEALGPLDLQDKNAVDSALNGAACRRVSGSPPTTDKPKKRRRRRRAQNPESELPVAEIDYDCDMTLQSPQHLLELYKCDKCDKSFVYESHFKAHRQEHDNTNKEETAEKFTCRICHQSYAKLKLLRTHMRSHIGKPSYSCNVCKKNFQHSWELTVHSRVHSGVGAVDSSSLVHSAVTAIQDKKYYCKKCGKGFNITGLYNDHMTMHKIEEDRKRLNMRENQCHICGDQLANATLYLDHIENHTRPAQCNLCYRQCKNMAELKLHTENVHGGESFVCQVCGKSFTKGKEFGNHCLREHGDRRPFKCSTCRRTFATGPHLRRHVQRHTGERRIKCPFCAFTYPSARCLKIHMYKNHLQQFQSQFVKNMKSPDTTDNIPVNEAELAEAALVSDVPGKSSNDNSRTRKAGNTSINSATTSPETSFSLENGNSRPDMTSEPSDDELYLDPDLLIVSPELLTSQLQDKIQVLD